MKTAATKTSNHEEISVEDHVTQSRMRFVRPERFVGTALQGILKIGESKFEILNYSAFGMAVVIEKNVQLHTGPNAAVFLLGEIEVQQVLVELTYRSSLSNEKDKAAFQVHGKPIDVEKASAMLEATTVAETFTNRIKDDSKFNPEFRRAVLEVRDFLSELRNSLSELENEWSQLPPHMKTSKEQGAGAVISTFLETALRDYYTAVALSMQYIKPEEKVAYFNFFRQKVMDLILEAPFAYRAYTKPLGYAGDFEMMNLIYRDDFEGESLFAKCLHKYYIDQSAARAVKNRSHYLETKIRNALRTYSSEIPVRILSVACGPAAEIYRYVSGAIDSTSVEFTLLDQDLKALQFAQHRIREEFLKNKVEHVKVEYVHTAIKNVIIKGLGKPNHYEMIYSAGLFDYLSDNVALACMKQLYAALKPGGTLVIGNFDIFPNRPHMEMALDWHLIIRTQEDMLKLGKQISSDCQIEAEKERVNLFLVINKPG